MKTKLNYIEFYIIWTDLEWNQEVFLHKTFSGGYMKLMTSQYISRLTFI